MKKNMEKVVTMLAVIMGFLQGFRLSISHISLGNVGDRQTKSL